MRLSTAYPKWPHITPKISVTLLELILLGLCSLIPDVVDAHILVYRRPTNQLIEEYNDLPAQFGPSLPPNGLKVFAIPAHPLNGCEKMATPPSSSYPPNAKFVAIIIRGGANCNFEMKVRFAQAARFDAVVVYNNEGDDLETMSAANSTGIRIPSVFVGHTTGLSLSSFFTDEIVILINDELPFNINTQLILPFSILIGACFLTMIFYMIYKCIREERRLRRHRLPKSMLKKLPVLKYTKNSEIAQETCVICIEDFAEGDKLRVLPCKHYYHTHCIDPWLTENRRVCPICKRKVFTKGEARSNRTRQSSLDSVTDTDDDTTPLLQPSTNSNNNPSVEVRGNSRRGGGGTGRSTPRRANANTSSTTTPHGTFRRGRGGNAGRATSGNSSVEVPTSDEENVLLSQQSPLHSARRVNPFDRSPNLPPHLQEELNAANRRSLWSYPIFRLFRRRQPISVAAPPFLEEVIPSSVERYGVAIENQPSNTDAATNLTPIPSTSSLPHASNNILNPNLSGSFKDEDEMPHQSIYEPISTPTTTAAATTPTRIQAEANRERVENDTSIIVQGGAGSSSSTSRRNTDTRFLI